jgi:asparagine synthase (glutamine-hydrolysing)
MTRESLAALQRRGIVRPQYIAALLGHHETSHATYYGVMIWVLMMLEQWLAARARAPARP